MTRAKTGWRESDITTRNIKVKKIKNTEVKKRRGEDDLKKKDDNYEDERERRQ